jgi:hypothetical protein
MSKGPPALINPKMLKWAREERGFDVISASEKLRLSPEDLKDFENGTKQISFVKFREAAKYYRRASAVFFLKEIPKPLRIPGFRRLPNRENEPISPELKLEIRRFHQKREDAIELLEYAPAFDWKYLDSMKLIENPEEVGLYIRKLLRVPDSFPIRLDSYQAFNSWRERIEAHLFFIMRARILGALAPPVKLF